jgi:DNA-directed RNA polymerase specialized sigma24 family protein
VSSLSGSGDQGSFTRFVEDAGWRIQAALAAGFGRQAGVEAAAEAIAYGWEHWDRIAAMDNPAGYVYVVGRDRARRAQRRLASVPAGRLEVLPGRDVEPLVEPGLQAALAELSDRQRAVVMLVHGAEWNLGEVAELLDLNRGSVKQHLDRGMEKLRLFLGGG